mgnify:CR=1 FL=1
MRANIRAAFGKPEYHQFHAAMLEQVLPCKLESLPENTRKQLASVDKSLPVIVVLYYGGTIGMLPDEQGRLVPSDDAERLLKPLEMKQLGQHIQVVWYPVYPAAIDSTNGRWCHWATIANAIVNLYDLVDGFVVCGGTDTMAHLAAALNFALPNLGKPVICSGSQLPMFELGDDGTGNLYFSLLCAASDLSGCHLVFGDELMHGLKVHKTNDRRFKAFTCPNQWILGHFDGSFVRYSGAPRRNKLVYQQDLRQEIAFRDGVEVSELNPGTFSPNILWNALNPLNQSLLLVTYGAGNTRDQKITEIEPTHIECLRVLYENQFPVVLGSPMIDGRVDSPYHSGVLAVLTDDNGGGAISGGDTTGPALSVKMQYVMARCWDDSKNQLDYQAFREGMHKNWVGELSMELAV